MGQMNSSSRAWFGRVRGMDRYFLEEKCPFSQKRRLNIKNVKTLGGMLLGGSIAAILFLGESAEQASENNAATVTKPEEIATVQAGGRQVNEGSISMGGGWNSATSTRSTSMGGYRSGGSNRQYTASQIVRPGEGNGNGFGLPMGSTIAAKLVNTLLSSDSNQPVIAEVLEDAIWRNSVLIPAGTRAIGTAGYDDASKRLQVRFNTFVYPEGDQHAVSALGLLQNGSSGIPGEYHSGKAQKEIGRFLGTFVGGLADGMKERQAGGQSGIAFEPGSIRNGILNGITVSALDQAKSASEDMQNVHPYLEVPGGSTFLLYFEREYSP